VVDTMTLFVLRYLFIQLLERLIRIDQLLTAASSDSASSTDRVIAVYSRRINEILARARRWLARIEGGASISHELESEVLRALLMAFNEFDELHLRLGFVGTKHTTSEVELFARAVFEPARRLTHQTSVVTVVASDHYVFEETKLDLTLAGKLVRVDIGDGTPTILLPKIELSNPLNWCSLIHECGHMSYAALRNEIATPIKHVTDSESLTRSGRAVLNSWLEETFCDLLATKLLGPAFLASFIDVAVATAPTIPLEGISATHPDVRFRVTAMWESLRRDSVTGHFTEPIAGCDNIADLALKIFEERARLERVHSRDFRETAPPFAVDVKAFRAALINNIERVLPKKVQVATLQASRIESLHARLARDIPIAACRDAEFDSNAEAAARDRLSALEKLLSSDDDQSRKNRKIRESWRATAASVCERPCAVAEILNAAWLYKWEHIYWPLLKEGDVASDRVTANLRNQLDRLDTVVRTSIETAYLSARLLPFLNSESASKSTGVR